MLTIVAPSIESGAWSAWDATRTSCCRTAYCRRWPSARAAGGLASPSDSWAWWPTAGTCWSSARPQTTASTPGTRPGPAACPPSSAFGPRTVCRPCRRTAGTSSLHPRHRRTNYLCRIRRLRLWFGLFVCLSVCLSVCLFVCLSVGLLANLWTDFDEIFWRDSAWFKDQVIQFWCRSGSRFGSGVQSPKSGSFGSAEVCALRVHFLLPMLRNPNVAK